MHGKPNLGQLGYAPSLQNDSRLMGILMFADIQGFPQRHCMSILFVFQKGKHHETSGKWLGSRDSNMKSWNQDVTYQWFSHGQRLWLSGVLRRRPGCSRRRTCPGGSHRSRPAAAGCSSAQRAVVHSSPRDRKAVKLFLQGLSCTNCTFQRPSQVRTGRGQPARDEDTTVTPWARKRFCSKVFAKFFLKIRGVLNTITLCVEIRRPISSAH